MPERDPKDIVTPYAFTVAPELLGLRLASPLRRGVALAIDGVLLAILANAPGLLLAIAAAVVLLRVSAGQARRGFVRRAARIAAVAILVPVVLSLWGTSTGPGRTSAPASGADRVIAGREAVPVAAELVALRGARSDARARRHAERLVEQLERHGMHSAEIAELLELATAGAGPRVQEAVDSILPRLTGAPAGQADRESRLDEAAAAFLEARASGESAAIASRRAELSAALSGNTLDVLQREAVRAAEALAAAERQRRGVRGIVDFLRQLARDMGLGAGWAALYFTAFAVLWRGQTPGKRFMGIRIVKLSGQPITWWGAFGRFGGYAAGVATGLVGFLQVYWDPNRQAVHDKIAQTVVVRANAPPLAVPMPNAAATEERA